jgi:hypothetical protein
MPPASEAVFSYAPSEEEFGKLMDQLRVKSASKLKKLRFFEGGLTPAMLLDLVTVLNEQYEVTHSLSTLYIWKNRGLNLEHAFAYRRIGFLSLELNEIDDAGAQVIAVAMIKCDNLESLKLNHNRITSAGADCIASALAEQWSLKELHLAHNSISDLGAQALINALDVHKRLKSMNLDGNPHITAIVMTEIRTRFPVVEGHLSKYGV